VKLDGHFTIVREKDQGPGDLGDSCADTARITMLSLFPAVDLTKFRTPKGYIRHPDSPWREDDFSSDQAAPLYMAYTLDPNRYPGYAWEMEARLSPWRTGDGKRLSPGLWALVNRFDGLVALITLLQGVLFLFPLRWNDSHHGDIKHWWQRIQWGGDEGDYLNWIAYIEYLDMLGYKHTVRACYMLRSTKTCMQKVAKYYANQPNSEWVLDIYLDHFSGLKRRLNV